MPIQVLTVEELSKINDTDQIKDNEYCDEIIDIFKYIDELKSIKDPEFPYTLSELGIIKLLDIQISIVEKYKRILIKWTPTVSNCGFASSIALCIRYKLMQDMIGNGSKLDIIMNHGMHDDEKNSQ